MSEVYLVKLDIRYITTFGKIVYEQAKAGRFTDDPRERETGRQIAERVAGYRADCFPPARVVRLADGVEHELA